MIHKFAIRKADVWLIPFFVNPEITKPFAGMEIKRHTVPPGLGYFPIKMKNKIS